MRIEKLSNNKLKIIFSIGELEKENIDYHAFMSGSTRCENIITRLLYISKYELDFDTKYCKIEIETLEVTHGNIVLTITKFEKIVKKLKVKRKQGNLEKHSCIYEFDNLDNYHDFTSFLKTNFTAFYNKFEKCSEFYTFSNKYLLIVDGSYFSDYETKIFNTSITEFASFKSNSETLILKLKEEFLSFLGAKKDAL